MFEWMNRHKKDIMTYTLWLVIPSFVVLYGYGECAKPQRYTWVARVNGESIHEYEWIQLLDNLQDRMQQYGQDVERDELRGQALDAAIMMNLNRIKADEFGVHTLDSEVSQTIRELPYFKDQAGNFRESYYYALLNQVGRNPIQFEEEQRDTITRNKLRAAVANSFFPAGNETARVQEREEQKIQVDYLAFEPSRYVDDVTPDEEGMKAFFEKNKEDYRIADQRRISYAKFFPAQFVASATFTDYQLNRFFEENREQYKVPDSVMVDYLTYAAQNFVDKAQASEEEIQAYYDANKSSFNHAPQIQIRYIVQPMAALMDKQDVTDEEIKEYYDQNVQRFTHKEEQAKARHILLKTSTDATDEQDEAVKNRILEIRKEIEGGLAFSEAAKKYSEGPSADRGGDLGFFGRDQMVAPFAEAAFSLPLGQVSEPVKTRYGYHLILVDERKPEGTDTLDQAREEISKSLRGRKAMTAFREEMEQLTSLDSISDRYDIQSTDWFTRGADLPGLTSSESSMISSVAFRGNANSTVSVAGYPNSENLFAIERMGRMESRPKTLEEAREEVTEKVKEGKSAELARAAAQADVDRIRSASVELSAIASERGLKVQTSDFFSRQDQFVGGFGVNPTELVTTAFTLKQGEFGGPLRTSAGYHIIRLVAREPEHIPELAEVQQQVERDCIQEKAEQLAQLEARKFTDMLFNQQISLEVGAASEQVECGTTGLFTLQDPLPEINQQMVNYSAFQIEKVGDISDPVAITLRARPMTPNQKQSIESYFVLQLKEIKESYLPEMDEKKEDVEKDYRLLLAEAVAKKHAREALDEIQKAIASSQPASATKAIELKQFEDASNSKTSGKGAQYRGPSEITGNGMVTGISGRAWAFTKTALALEPGQVSGLVACYKDKRLKEGEVVQGPMVGVYILQVLGKQGPEEGSEPATSVRDRLARRLQSLAFEAWIDEVSATANIEYNDKVLFPEKYDEESFAEEGEEEQAAS